MASPIGLLLKDARETLKECLPSEQPNCPLSNDGLLSKLQHVLSAINTAMNANPGLEFSSDEKADIWHVISDLAVSSIHKPWIARGHSHTI